MECTLSNPVLSIDWAISSINVETVGVVFGSCLLFWSLGIGVGTLIAIVRKARL